MNVLDLRDAERLWGLIIADADDRQIAKTALASQLRSTGLEATLRWLEAKRPTLAERICDVLDLPRNRQDRGALSNLELLAKSRRALALAEALHLLARAR